MHNPPTGKNALQSCAAADVSNLLPARPTMSAGTSVQPSSAALPPVPGYEVLEVIGRGSMGVVYKARQIGLSRHVALKMIRSDAPIGHEELDRFISEARIVASLQHPNIVQVFEINLQADAPYFSMELVEGGTLADRLGGRPQPFRDAAQLSLVLARTIHVAHEIGIVHRDLKPANILIALPESRLASVRHMSEALDLQAPGLTLGTPKITDFGLAKELHADARQTESGIIMGTPSYMSPEQAEGKSREVGPAADIYSLGAILYEMLTGRPPFTAESPMETMLLLFQAEPVAPSRLQPKVPRDLETICLKCLAKDPQRRYRSALELANDLQRFLSGEPILARPASYAEQLGKAMRRRPVLATALASSLLALVSVLAILVWHQFDLAVRLDEAIQDEQDTRAAQLAASERAHFAELRDKLKDLLHSGETALTAHDWQQAQAELARARDQAGDAPELAGLRGRIEQLAQETEAQRQDHERRATFFRCRNDALFHATLFTGGNVAASLQDTQAAADKALGLFGIDSGAQAGPSRGPSNIAQAQPPEIVSACYELLIVLADATAKGVPGQPDAKRQQGAAALRILDHTIGLGIATHAYHRRRAQYLDQTGDRAAAALERQRAVAMPPTTPLDHFLLAQELYNRGECKQAIRAFENVLQQEPNHFWASYYLGLCWLKEQRPDQTVTCLTACLGQRNDFPWLYLLRAVAWGELGQFAHAEVDFAATLKSPLSEATRYALLINRGVLRLRQDQLDSARADLDEAIALRPKYYQGYLNLAQADVKQQRWSAAITQLDRAIACEPGLAALYRTRSRLHLAHKDQAAALTDLDEAIRLEIHVGRPVAADDHLERGRLLHLRGDFEPALAAYDRACRIRPSDPRAYRLRAEALVELKRWPAALAALDGCLKYGPPDAAVLQTRGAVRSQLGQYAGAQADYTRAVELAPTAATYAARGWCYVVSEAPKLALADFEAALRLGPAKGDAYAGRGYSRVLLGAVLPALEDAEAALQLGPPSPRLDYNVARIYALAAVSPDNESVAARRQARSQREQWEQRAMQLVTRALDRQSPGAAAHFWQTVVQGDRAMGAVRPRWDFKQLAARYRFAVVDNKVILP